MSSMKILALDISTKTGWAIFETGVAQPVSFGVFNNPVAANSGPYPASFMWVAKSHAAWLKNKVRLDSWIVADQWQIPSGRPSLNSFDTVVIEETNKTGRFGSRHSQKLLEFLHYMTVDTLLESYSVDQIKYVNTSDWRKKLNLSVAETKKLAKPKLREFEALKKALLSEKDRAKKRVLKGNLETLKQDLKARCIHGKIDKKSIAVAFANATWGLSLKKGDNDIADALCLGEAYRRGVHTLTNKDIFDRNNK